MVDRLHLHIQGRVQGVGFRYAATRQATRLGLSGWVRNREDGSVEAEFEGDRETLLHMLDWCRKGPAFALVTQVSENWETGPPRYDGFRVQG